jgi:hypothetical protein
MIAVVSCAHIRAGILQSEIVIVPLFEHATNLTRQDSEYPKNKFYHKAIAVIDLSDIGGADEQSTLSGAALSIVKPA